MHSIRGDALAPARSLEMGWATARFAALAGFSALVVVATGGVSGDTTEEAALQTPNASHRQANLVVAQAAPPADGPATHSR